MSILIKDMKMPERCLECPLYDNYNYYCILYSFGIPVRYNRDGNTRPEWCEIKELPECDDAVSIEPPTTTWLGSYSPYTCEKCGYHVDSKTRYCPDCGRKAVNYE